MVRSDRRLLARSARFFSSCTHIRSFGMRLWLSSDTQQLAGQLLSRCCGGGNQRAAGGGDNHTGRMHNDSQYLVYLLEEFLECGGVVAQHDRSHLPAGLPSCAGPPAEPP